LPFEGNVKLKLYPVYLNVCDNEWWVYICMWCRVEHTISYIRLALLAINVWGSLKLLHSVIKF
jgi:hypothetical protein